MNAALHGVFTDVLRPFASAEINSSAKLETPNQVLDKADKDITVIRAGIVAVDAGQVVRDAAHVIDESRGLGSGPAHQGQKNRKCRLVAAAEAGVIVAVAIGADVADTVAPGIEFAVGGSPLCLKIQGVFLRWLVISDSLPVHSSDRTNLNSKVQIL
jgi:hypothetical protein